MFHCHGKLNEDYYYDAVCHLSIHNYFLISININSYYFADFASKTLDQLVKYDALLYSILNHLTVYNVVKTAQLVEMEE